MLRLKVGKLLLRRVVKRFKTTWPILLALVVIVASIGYRHIMPIIINPVAYGPLLEVIAKGESSGNYNAYFGNGTNTSLRFTEMSVGEVLQWQEQYVQQGSVSNAVGKYQIIRPTLAGLVQKLGTPLDAPFNEALQDSMAIALLERRGAIDFAENKITREQFAANLAKEWAALPKVTGTNPHESYYAGDGINKAHVSIDEVYEALAMLQSRLSA